MYIAKGSIFGHQLECYLIVTHALLRMGSLGDPFVGVLSVVTNNPSQGCLNFFKGLLDPIIIIVIAFCIYSLFFIVTVLIVGLIFITQNSLGVMMYTLN